MAVPKTQRQSVIKTIVDIKTLNLQAQNKQLQAELDGYEGAILEPLKEKYKFTCEENVNLQAELKASKAETRLWKKRLDEAANSIAEFEKLQVELKAEQEKFEAQCEYTTDLEAQLRWIPVAERLPDRETTNLALLDSGNVVQVCDPDWDKPSGILSDERITHWKPITLPKDRRKQ